jgi:fructokinase
MGGADFGMSGPGSRGADDFLLIGLGEVLWDLLPSGRQLGGAPANFAYHAASLGDRAVVASRVGRDEPGDAALARLRQLGLATDFIQREAEAPAAGGRPTGSAAPRLDRDGQAAAWTIATDVAWDNLEWSPAWATLAAEADAVCFGSLAQRSARSRATIRRFLDATRAEALRIFDINLRQSDYSAETLAESLARATIVKLNDAELPVVARLLGLDVIDGLAGARRLLDAFPPALVCVTRGARGSLLVSASDAHEHPGIPTTVVDTVGAGDAFTAAMAHHTLRGAPLAAVSEAANRLGAWVAARAGATPTDE